MTQHSWMPGHNPWPLWFIKRVGEVGDSNCSFQEMDVRVVSTFDLQDDGEAFASNFDMTLPVLVNSKDLSVGEELRVFWAVRHTSRPSTKMDKVTWASQARTSIGKQNRKK